MNHRSYKKLFVLLSLIYIPPALIWLLLVWSDLIKVINTGICPPSPPDIPAYPCSLLEFLARMTMGPWTFIPNILIFVAWAVILTTFISLTLITRFYFRKLNCKK